ncbi:hypothetical protein ABEH29_10525 [Pantoea agglomerans]|uniref:hypothetical protein n=1 Tax=Enterobacter agglomerans TaxID=549 RepID=UPI00165435CA|nr:hypothetical protein [Pantoea agglomerans]
MSSYALIKEGIVVNAVLWDGQGDIFQEYEKYEIKDGEQVGPGYTAKKDSKGKWSFSAPVVEITPEEHANKNIQAASSAYDLASAKITALNEIIEDEDYSSYPEADVRAQLSTWTSYRKALRAYISEADGKEALPAPPSF